MERATNMEESSSIHLKCSKEETDISYQFNVPCNVESINFKKKESWGKLYKQRKNLL